MKSTAKIIAGLALAGLLAACSGHKPTTATATARTTVVKPQAKAQRKMYFIPPPRLPGQMTVEDVLQGYSAYATSKLTPYFAKAKVSYPPPGKSPSSP